MRQREDELKELGVQVAVVTFEAGFMAQAYVRETHLEWPILVDEDRALYQAYGMERGTWWNIFGPAAWWVYAKLLLKGRRLQASHGDVNQLGGDVLIDPAGTIRVHHVGNGPADRPSVQSLIDAVRGGRSS